MWGGLAVERWTCGLQVAWSCWSIVEYLLLQFSLCLYFPFANFLCLVLKSSMKWQHSTNIFRTLLCIQCSRHTRRHLCITIWYICIAQYHRVNIKHMHYSHTLTLPKIKLNWSHLNWYMISSTNHNWLSILVDNILELTNFGMIYKAENKQQIVIIATLKLQPNGTN